ncbi:MAG: hypothetical protein IIX19_00705 [Alistipes sp.]|nr:hypothetical protein [Alistipes sp.]
MGLIENPKTYTGRDLETIFFRPMFSGENAEQLGIRMLYNMPVPTTIQMWSPKSDILQEYESGWRGGTSSLHQQKTIELHKVKAEVGFSASDYFQQVYELIVGRADVNLDDLTGTELEQAETEMFRAAIAESIRATMWIGDTSAEAYNKFDGFLVKLLTNTDAVHVDMSDVTPQRSTALDIFSNLWLAAPPQLKAMKGDGNLAFLVTSDIYDAYEQYLDSCGSDAAYNDLNSGRRELSYHGIKIVDMGISHLLPTTNIPNKPIAMLTDRRNLVLAVNTADYPGSEVRMWYNPDEMQNRQRAIFMVGCEVLDESLVVCADF